MCKTWIVANRDNFANPIKQALCEKADCQALTMTEVNLWVSSKRLQPPGGAQPNLLIVDLQSIDQAAWHFFEGLSHNNPEISVIVIVPAGNPLPAKELMPFGVDEILIRPVDENQMRRTIEGIWQRIAAFDRLLGLQEKLRKEMGQCQIVAKSKPMREIVQRLPQLAASSSTVFITGETGTGKELFARAIHYLGPRAGQPFITIDCGSMPDHLVENELFGHVRGAYTDANSASKGLIQEADGGTLFLDEVEALPLGVQTKFLRFLQERQYKPLGQSKYVSVNIRVAAASNTDLARAVAEKKFREDLYYRLNVVPLFIPPLRERKADIPALVRFFLQRHNRDHQSPMQIPAETLRNWMEYDWPGNVRELENKVQQWLAMAAVDNPPNVDLLSGAATRLIRPLAEARKETLAQFEQTYLRDLLTLTKGNISAAARLAGTDRKHLRGLLKKHGVYASRFR
ncbi:sigma-54 dependent transcriptional regulator [candidate division KSB1 bacterium]|nr:sigma-54 dependent transcriptional regulator [candidate division KSB1 bacterium]